MLPNVCLCLELGFPVNCSSLVGLTRVEQIGSVNKRICRDCVSIQLRIEYVY